MAILTRPHKITQSALRICISLRMALLMGRSRVFSAMHLLYPPCPSSCSYLYTSLYPACPSLSLPCPSPSPSVTTHPFLYYLLLAHPSFSMPCMFLSLFLPGHPSPFSVSHTHSFLCAHPFISLSLSLSHPDHSMPLHPVHDQ